MITITLDRSPLSMNSAYPSSKSGRRFLSQDGKEYKKQIELAIGNKRLDVKSNQYVTAEVHCYFKDVFNKDGSIKKRKHDLDNHLKLLFDSASSCLGFDDSLIMSIEAHKRQGEPKTILILRTHSLSSLD